MSTFYRRRLGPVSLLQQKGTKHAARACACCTRILLWCRTLTQALASHANTGQRPTNPSGPAVPSCIPLATSVVAERAYQACLQPTSPFGHRPNSQHAHAARFPRLVFPPGACAIRVCARGEFSLCAFLSRWLRRTQTAPEEIPSRNGIAVQELLRGTKMRSESSSLPRILSRTTPWRQDLCRP